MVRDRNDLGDRPRGRGGEQQLPPALTPPPSPGGWGVGGGGGGEGAEVEFGGTLNDLYAAWLERLPKGKMIKKKTRRTCLDHQRHTVKRRAASPSSGLR